MHVKIIKTFVSYAEDYSIDTDNDKSNKDNRKWMQEHFKDVSDDEKLRNDAPVKLDKCILLCEND